MKFELPYEDFKQTCIRLADELPESVTELIAVPRGGLSVAHIMAKRRNLPIGVYYPKDDHLKTVTTPSSNSHYVFVEDLVAEGRTLASLNRRIQDETRNHSHQQWETCAFLVDGKYYASNKPMPDYYGLILYSWVVFPYEEDSKIQEGDRSLFRNTIG